ncbi:MAG: amino acid ABC transporter permease [Ardenticatenaceae bacterium]
MASTPGNSLSNTPRGQINWNYFLQDNLTGSRSLMIWVIVLALITVGYTWSRLSATPVFSGILFLAWLVGILLVIAGEMGSMKTPAGKWLKENLFSSVSNSLLTLLLTMVIGAAFYGFYQWGWVNANFDSAETGTDFRDPNGATWGVIYGARKLLLTGPMGAEGDARAAQLAWILVSLGGLSAVVTFFKQRIEESTPLVKNLANNGLLVLWSLTPFVSWILLFGIEKGDSFYPASGYSVFGIDIPTVILGTVLVLALYGLLWWFKVVKFSSQTIAAWALAWPIAHTIWRYIGWQGWYPPTDVNELGGYVLTLIMAVSVIALSFPIGIFLALGRRSKVFGVPRWITWPLAIIAFIWFINSSTLPGIADARSSLEVIFAFWPVLIILLAWMFYRNFAGNVIAATCTATIELVRGVPLITILFMAIVMAPFFLPPGTSSFPRLFAVIIGYTLFSAAYMAENIRGGLQAIPKGQYEAADALGFNNLQKMRFIIMPQALRIVIPAIVGQFIGTYKSSSLVSIVGLFDLLGITRTIVANDQWLGLRRELYIFLAVVYFVGSAIMSWYSRRLEKQLGVGQR